MKSFFTGFILFYVMLLSNPGSAIARDVMLGYADSLFRAQKYTEAFKDYERIFENGQASPAMLAKMAFIREGLGNYADALYYLNIYYQQTADKAALTKMRDIAEEHNLSGYEYSDFKFFLNFIGRYETELILGLLAISAFLLVYIFKSKMRKETPATATVLQVFVVILAAVLINGMLYDRSAIVNQDYSPLMTGPSAASEPTIVLEKGHKVEVLEADDVWSRIRWEDEVVYIRSKNLRML